MLFISLSPCVRSVMPGVEHDHKDSLMFIHLLHKLKRTYRKARRIVLITDTYVIHKSGITGRCLASNSKFELVFPPADCRCAVTYQS